MRCTTCGNTSSSWMSRCASIGPKLETGERERERLQLDPREAQRDMDKFHGKHDHFNRYNWVHKHRIHHKLHRRGSGFDPYVQLVISFQPLISYRSPYLKQIHFPLLVGMLISRRKVHLRPHMQELDVRTWKEGSLRFTYKYVEILELASNLISKIYKLESPLEKRKVSTYLHLPLLSQIISSLWHGHPKKNIYIWKINSPM